LSYTPSCKNSWRQVGKNNQQLKKSKGRSCNLAKNK